MLKFGSSKGTLSHVSEKIVSFGALFHEKVEKLKVPGVKCLWGKGIHATNTLLSKLQDDYLTVTYISEIKMVVIHVTFNLV